MRVIESIEILKWDEFVHRQVDFWGKAGIHHPFEGMNNILGADGKNVRKWVVVFNYKTPGWQNLTADRSFIDRCNALGGSFVHLVGMTSFEAFATNDPTKVHLLRLCHC